MELARAKLEALEAKLGVTNVATGISNDGSISSQIDLLESRMKNAEAKQVQRSKMSSTEKDTAPPPRPPNPFGGGANPFGAGGLKGVTLKKTVPKKKDETLKRMEKLTITEEKSMEKVIKTDEEWKASLTPEEYNVLRGKGTDAKGGEYDHLYPKEGYFKCRACGFPLYSVKTKFDSGCGWPAFKDCFYSDDHGCHVGHAKDTAHGMDRVEILCKKCDGHLGHVFIGESGVPSPEKHVADRERHCVNSTSVKYDKAAPPEGDYKNLRDAALNIVL